jgi:RHS repeat-associated protein
MYNAKGEKTWEADLDIYGKVRTFAGRSLSDCPFRYQGQYEDSETGLYYNRFRYYDPSIGSYISQDPIGLLGGMFLYSYANNTNKRVDVYGLMPWPKGEPKPKGWRLPTNGTWSGEAGHSIFILNDPTSIGLPEGAKIPFVDGTPDFSSIQVREPIYVDDLTGDQNIDKRLTAEALSKKYPNEFPTKQKALDWMSNDSITPHHFQGNQIQLVPTKPHSNIRHSGTAHELRIGGH